MAAATKWRITYFTQLPHYRCLMNKGLVNGAIGYTTEIVWPHFRRTQMYETDVPSVQIDFGRDGIHLIHPQAIQFPAKISYGTAERRALRLILSWASTVHKMQGSCVAYLALIYDSFTRPTILLFV